MVFKKLDIHLPYGMLHDWVLQTGLPSYRNNLQTLLMANIDSIRTKVALPCLWKMIALFLLPFPL